MSTTKGMYYTTAKKCPVHQDIRDRAIEQLTRKGVFEKDRILNQSRYKAMSDSIRWDYIARMIEEEYDTALVPLAGSFWPKGPKDSLARKEFEANPPSQVPGRYVAGGHGRKTAGYAIASSLHGYFVIHLLNRKEKQIVGIVNKHNDIRRRATRAGVQSLPNSVVVGHKQRVALEAEE